MEVPVELKIIDEDHFVLESENLMFDGQAIYKFGNTIAGKNHNLVVNKVDELFSPQVYENSYIFTIHKKYD